MDWITAKVEKTLTSNHTEYSTEALTKLSSLPERFLQSVGEHAEGRDVFGLIHSDLEPHNIVISDGQPCPVDVMAFGFGYYLSDILTLFRHFSEDEQTIFFDGYQEIRPLPTDYRQQSALFEELRVL